MPRMAFLRRTLYLKDERHHLQQPTWLEALLERGILRNDIPGRFNCGHGVNPSDVAPFFESHGFESVDLFSLESFTAGLETTLSQMAETEPDTYAMVMQMLLANANDPSILGMALHLLYVGKKVVLN